MLMSFRFCLLLLLLVSLGRVELWSAPRLAIFSEADFPSHSRRQPEWHAAVVRQAGGEAQVLGLAAWQQQADQFDGIVFPHGGCVPAEAEAAVGRLLARGGLVLICGEMQENVGYPPEIAAAAAQLEAGGERRGEFMDRHGSGLTGIVRRHPETGAWIAPYRHFYYDRYAGTLPTLFQELGLETWPNHASIYGANYQRPLTSALGRHPLLEQMGLGEYFPPVFEPVAGETVRLQRYTPEGKGADFAFGEYFALYQFAEPSGAAYPAMPQKGKERQDCDTDFFLYRRFDQRQRGGTLIVLGKVGLRILESEAGGKMLQGLLLLASRPLPGTLPLAYMDAVHQLEQEAGQVNRLYLEVAKDLAEVATLQHYRGGQADVAELNRQLKALRRHFSAVNHLQEQINAAKLSRRQLPEDQMAEMRLRLSEARQFHQEMLAASQAGGPTRKPEKQKSEHAYGRLRWAATHFSPWGDSSLAELAAKVADLGITEIELYSRDWGRSSAVFNEFGLGAGYRLNHAYGGADVRVDSGNLDPRSQQVRPAKVSVYSDRRAVLERDRGWILRRAAREPGIRTVFFAEERDMQWSLWGPYMHGLFLDWLQRRHGTVENLNRQWQSAYPTFAAISLPLQRPQTPPEHALWEDWTRYREIYRIEKELRPEVEMIRQHAPGLRPWMYGSYYLQKNHPANGINYYELGKLLDPACLESGPGIAKEVLASDIVAFRRKAVNTEWAAFYHPSDDPLTNIRRMKAELWDTVNGGTIGMFLYMGGNSKNYQSNLINPSGIVQPLGWQFREVSRDFQLLQHLYLDGERSEPAIRIIYSPTTRRHTSWPGIELDRSLECVSGYYEASQKCHIPARAIDEQAIVEGLLPDACQLLVLPQAEFIPADLWQRLEAFVAAGGTLLTTVDSGRYDAYGRRRDWVLQLAGVVPRPLAGARLGGMVMESFPGQTWSLEPVFPETVEVLRRYASGEAAVTSSRHGQGRVVVLGFPFGREFHHQLNRQRLPEARQFWQQLVSELGLPPAYRCEDDNLVIRPWTHKGDSYLMLNYRFRSRPPIQDNRFPLASADALCTFALHIRGAFQVEDYLLGERLPTTFDGEYTQVQGIIENPGGKVYRLQAVPGQAGPATPAAATTAAAASSETEGKPGAPETAAGAEGAVFPLPYEGNIFLADGSVRLGAYVLTADFVKDGQWQGKAFLTLAGEGMKIRRQIEAGQEIRFRFPDQTVILQCQAVSTAMPERVQGRFSAVPTEYLNDCRLRQEKFHGRASWILENRWIYARFVPELGGRLVEFRSAADGLEHMKVFPENFSRTGGETYVDYGGLEINAGRHMSPGWNTPHAVNVVSAGPERLELELVRSQPYAWRYGGALSFAHRVVLQRDSAWLEMQSTIFNESAMPDQLKLRTHPVFNIAGDYNSEDGLHMPGAGQTVRMLPLRAGRNESFANHGSWCAMLDASARCGLYQSFAAEAVDNLYSWMGSDAYNFEVFFKAQETAPQAGATFSWRLGLIQGLSSLASFAPETGVFGEAQSLSPWQAGRQQDFAVGLTATRPFRCHVRASIRQGDQILHRFAAQEGMLSPERATRFTFSWSCLPVPDGSYEFLLEHSPTPDFAEPGRTVLPIQVHAAAEKQQQEVLQAWQQRLEALKAAYQAKPEPGRRRRLIEASLILNQMRINLVQQEAAPFEENRQALEKVMSAP